MSKLSIDQKTIKELFSDKKADFLIPDYQRPYAWEDRKECQTLWDDLFSFAFPENDNYERDPEAFNTDEEYYLGPIVTFKNSNGQLEIIDGQQRLTTLMLLLRAFYSKFGKMADPKTRRLKESIEQCIWKLDEDENVIQDELKITSEVATDDDKDEFLDILRTGETKEVYKSAYAKNFNFFKKKIDQFKDDYPEYFSKLPKRIIDNCILLPIEADDQNTALRIFSTLNDRGKPLSDADIFKAQFYRFFSQHDKKKEFIEKWKNLEVLCNKIFHPITGTPMDELFTKYMYFERAKQGIKSSTTEALRRFYEKNEYALLKNENTFDNLTDLAQFWQNIELQNADVFSDDVLRKLFVLNYAPNGMWTYIVSVYYMQNRGHNGELEEHAFSKFLSKLIAFVWAYAIINPGVNALRTPVFAEMIKIVNGLEVDFAEFKFEKDRVYTSVNNYEFKNSRMITKSMLTWWAFQNSEQQLLSLDTTYEIEHIFARNRQSKERLLTDSNNIESLGNKSLLEKRINIRASDYRFEDKKKYYNGFVNSRNINKAGTDIAELKALSVNADFVEADIITRKQKIVEDFVDFLTKNDLVN